MTTPSDSVTSGVFPNNTYPLVNGELDFEQEKRLQARQEHDRAEGRRPDHPPFTEKGPDRVRAEAALEPVLSDPPPAEPPPADVVA